MSSPMICDPELPQGDSACGPVPRRMVKQFSDMTKWRRCRAFYDVLGFINGISTAIQGKKIRDEIHISSLMAKLLEILTYLNKCIDEIPPIQQAQRFGNKAYSIWFKKVRNELGGLLKTAIPVEKHGFVNELSYYLCESFGNPVRIDYGTGHELSFIFFLCALYKAELLNEHDNEATALVFFNKYLLLCRRLQLTYHMEPAGSQGVWSLDDFQFIPFIWGSAQLCHPVPFDPSNFLDEAVINEHKEDFMFISCIDYITKIIFRKDKFFNAKWCLIKVFPMFQNTNVLQVKTGHFAEHSNQLWSISAVPSWPRINTGLVKMYEKEILSKFPVIQHCLFGELMSFDQAKDNAKINPANLGAPTKLPAKHEITKSVGEAISHAIPTSEPSTMCPTEEIKTTCLPEKE